MSANVLRSKIRLGLLERACWGGRSDLGIFARVIRPLVKLG